MAKLADQDRAALWKLFMQHQSDRRTAMPLLKADILAAVNAIDDWVDANAASFNSAIPQPARGALSAAQKALLLMYVVNRRFEVL